ncbi:MAG: PLDc N-terminal domain-containing protein [Firmicutes bacterium]|nr:PLDc N-terminal domain-containing protein [Bacillota bacterium]
MNIPEVTIFMGGGNWFAAMVAFLLISLAVAILLAIWVYKDAKVKSQQPPILWSFVVFLFSWLGLIVYLVVGRKNKILPPPKTAKKPLIAAVVVWAISLVVFVAEFVDSANIFFG